VFVLGAIASWAQAQPQDDEYRVKAAFLYHFAQLVDWPPDATKNNNQQLLLCTYGDDPFQGKLEGIVEGKQVGTQVVHVRHLKQDKQEIGDCQVLFIGKNETKHLASLLAVAQNAPILTVGESDTFLRQGGMISFTLNDGKIRFEINLDAAQRARLKIGSRLLLLAEKITANSGGKQ
jgi:hypothetical protein